MYFIISLPIQEIAWKLAVNYEMAIGEFIKMQFAGLVKKPGAC
jgi:hypothetical protein